MTNTQIAFVLLVLLVVPFVNRCTAAMQRQKRHRQMMKWYESVLLASPVSASAGQPWHRVP